MHKYKVLLNKIKFSKINFNISMAQKTLQLWMVIIGSLNKTIRF